MTAPPSAPAGTPYVGPRAFDEGDQGIFFGREAESRQLAALVIAHRAVLLYSQSGAGKTSLLAAGLAPELKRRKRLETLPIGRVGGEARGDVANIFVYNTLLNIYGVDARPADLAPLRLSQGLAPFLEGGEDGRRPRPRLLILDQFEELFTTHAEKYVERSDFFVQLADCLNDYPALSLLLSMREDYIAHLDAYAGQLPDRLRTRLRLERLGRDTALSAVVDPLEDTGRAYAPDVAEALVDNLRRVRRRVVTEEGSDVASMPGRYVEPVHLQIVCQQLWNNLPPERELIEMDDVQQFGDVDQALTEFYEGALRAALPKAGMGERRVRDWIDGHLITPAHTRGLVFRGETATAGLPNTVIDIFNASYLVRADIRGGDTWYELAHDRLIEPILTANSAWHTANPGRLLVAAEAWRDSGQDPGHLLHDRPLADAERRLQQEREELSELERRFVVASLENRRQERARRQRLILSVAAIVFIVFAAITAWSLQQRADAVSNLAAVQEERNNVATLVVNLSTLLTVQAQPTADDSEFQGTAAPNATQTPNQRATLQAIQDDLANVQATQTAVAATTLVAEMTALAGEVGEGGGELPCDITTCATVIADSNVNVRSAPGEVYETIGFLAPNVTVFVIGRSQNGWLNIVLSESLGRYGWVRETFMQTNVPLTTIPLAPIVPPTPIFPEATSSTTETPNLPPANANLGDTWTRPIDGMVMVYVPPPEAPFVLESEVDAPAEGYWIDKYEVSNAQYQLCVAAAECEPSDFADDGRYNGANYPVVGVSWFDAAAYSAWVGGELPTEAEWEYAAAGDPGTVYPWGDDFDGTRLNFCDANCSSTWADESWDDGYALTAPVGSYPAGESWAGAADMAGNVWEWTDSWYDEDRDWRTLRGGSWRSGQEGARAASRLGYAPFSRDGTFSFRLVVRFPPSQ